MSAMPIQIQPPGRAADLEPRSVPDAMLRGARFSCPACGQRTLFRSFLKVADRCTHCGEELHHHRADDAPPYFTILIVGHLVVAGVLGLEQAVAPAQWVQLAVWVPLTVILSLWLLPHIKGALVGLQWACRMHGFGSGPDPADPLPPPSAASDLRRT